MPVEVTRMPNQPIIYALFTGTVTEQDVLEVFQRSVEISVDIKGSVYRITETRDIDTTLAELMMILKQMSTGQPGSSADPRFKPVLVGTDEFIKLVSDATYQEQYGKLNLPLFENFEKALAYTEERIAHAS